MANETDSVFAANQQNGNEELFRFLMSALKEGETDEKGTAQQQTPEVKKAKDEPAAQQPAAEPQSVQQPAEQPQEQPNGEVEQPVQGVQTVQGVQADELDDNTKDLLAIKNHNIDDARKYVEQLGKDTQEIMASGMSESAKREAQERYESAAKTLNERVETYNAEQKAENERLRAETERKQAQEKKEHEEKYADINYVSEWMDGHKVNDENNTMLTSEGFKEGAAAASGKDIFSTAKAAKEYISENTGKLSTAAISDYVNGMFAANRLKEKYGDKFMRGVIIEPIDSLVLENGGISDSVKKEFIKVRTPREFGGNNYQAILGNAVDDFVRLFEKEYKREQGKVGKKAMEDYENIVKNPFVAADDKDAARMVFASKVLTGVDLKPMIDRAFNSIPKDRMAALTLALSKNFNYDTDKAAEYIANEFQRVCLARTGAEVESDTEAAIVGGLMNTLVGSIAQASMRSTGGGNELTLLDAYSASIDERAKEWAKQGMAGYGKIALRSAVTMSGDYPAFKPLGKLVELGTKGVLTTLLPRFSKGVSSATGEAAFKMMSMTNSGRVVIGVANGAGLGAIYSPMAYTLGSLARGVTPDVGEALKSSGSGAVDFSLLGITPSIMNYGADKVLRLFNGTGKAATTIRVATIIAFKDIFGPGANAAIVTAKDALLSSDKISEDIKSYFFEKYGEFLGMHVPGKLSNIRHIPDEYKVRTQLNESVFTKEELRSLGYKSVKEMFDDIYAPRWKGDPGYHMEEGKAIAGKLYAITVNPKVLESAKMKLLTAIGGGAIATPTITRSEIVSEYGEKGKEVYTVRTYTADGKVFCERDFGSLKDAKLEETRLNTVIKRNNVAIAEGAKDAQWMDTCSERATRTVLSELNGTATENELADMLKTAFEKDRNGEQLTDGEKRMLKRFDEVYLQNLRSENADNSSSARRDFNKSRGVDIDKILAKDYYKWSESEREAIDEYIRELNGENTAKDMLSEPTEPPAEPTNEPPVVEEEKGEPQEEAAPEKETDKPSEEPTSKEDVGIEDYIKINKADEETANDIRDDVENYTDEVNALRAESEQAVKYSNGESSEKPEHWDYWKEKFGLEEPKVETGEGARPVGEPKSESEPIEPANEKPTEQPMEPKVEETPVEAETPKEEAKADTKAEMEQAAETEPVEEVEQEQPTTEQPTYKKGDELVAEHDGTPVTIVVDAVGKDGNVTKSHVKSNGEPYHSNGEVVFTPKEKPQEPTVKDWVDDVASEARKRGYRIVNGQRVERQGSLSEGVDVVYGDEHTTKFSQNDKPTTRFAVVSAKKMQPSHIRGQRNPAFFNDEGQPKNRTDQVSVAREEEIAKNIDPEEITVGVTAYQGAPTINSRGEVIQGNNRAAALREMYSGGYGMSVKKYKQFLKDNAKMFGLSAEDIDRIEDPVLVNVADVTDAEAIRLGQLKATDNESGGVQFIEPKPTVQKLVGANKLIRFMDTLLESENPMDSIKDLIRKNGVKALKFMRDMGIINETQYNSAFNAKDTLSSQARNDLEGVIRHAMFDGGPTGIEEMFDLMPDAAQKGILETIARDFSSDEQSKIKPIIQESILAYHNAVSTSKEFANAKTAEQAARAMRNYTRQVQLIGEEQVLPEKYFSKFALLLAERYRAYSKLSIKAMFNELYDKLQGVSESSGDLFAGEAAAEKLNINEAFKKVFNYGDTELPRGDVLGDTARTGTKGEPGSEGGTGGRGQDKAGERGTDGKGGTDRTAEEGANSLIDTASKAANKARLQKVEDYSAFAEQYGLDAEDVAMYAEGMKKGSTSQAMRARAMIGRKIIAAHEGEIHSLMDVRKFRRPIEEALKEKFGDVDKLLEEYRHQVEDEHKAMEAARKKAQEEEAKRKAHLEELSLLSDDEIDRRYMEALDNGNEVAARDMLDEAARRKGYADTDSEYQGVGAWVAPSNPGYESDEARRADVEDNAPNVNLEDMALGYSLQPDDYFTHPERYSQNTPHGLESARSIQAALEALKRGEKGVKVKVYRAVPISVKEGKLRNGDWVTPSKKYAEMHGNSRLEGKYRIIEDEVPANELWWDGNDANEWGYDNGKEYKYKNAKNNRKLNDLVVRDDNGNVIVPSKRFNQRKADERYQIGKEGVKPSKAEVALRDAVIDRLRENGMEVITDVAEGQRVLDEANGRAREMSFGEPYDYEAYPLGRVESNLADKEVMVVTAEADHGFMNYKEAKEWAKKNVSKVYNNEETGGKGDVRISNAAIDKFMSQSAVDKSDSKDVHLSVLKVLPEVLRTSIDVETHPDFLKGKDGKRSAENGMNKDVLVHRCYGAVEIGGKPYRVKITLKEDPRDVSFPHVTHSYEATKIELLAGTWENHEGPSPNTNNSISAAKLLENVEMSYNPSKKVLDASEKRSVGIREQRVWHSSGANFKDAKITDHIRFFRTANGEAYGFTVGGKIYIDPKIATSETPVHEYAHLWASALRSGNPNEWQNVVGLMKGTSVWEEVKKRYSELNTDDEIADEVIATYSGRRGAERLREEAHKVAESNGDVFEKAEAISALGRVKKSLKKFWKGVCDFLHIHYKSAEEVADRVMKDLLDGVEPMKIGKGEAGVRFSAKQKRALETAEQSQKTAIATAVSSADGAKVLNNLDTLARNLEKTSSHRKTFIGDIAKAFGVDNRGKSSKYATFETKSGEVVTIRISDHNAKVSNFDTVGEDNGISIVVTRKPNKGITNDGSAHIVEFFYPEISLQRAEGKPLAEIVRSIKQALYSGEFKDTTGLAERQEVNGEDVVRYQLSVAERNAKGGNTGYDSKHAEIEQAVNKELERNSTSDDIKAEIDRVKKLRAEATKEYLSGKPHSEVAKNDAAALRERLNALNAKRTIAVEKERGAKLSDKLADLNTKLIEATESGDTEKVKSLTTEIKRAKTELDNTGIRSRYKAKISEIKSKSENVSDLAKSLVKYISGELSPILAKEMGKAEFNALVGSVRDIAKQWNAKDGTEQDKNNLATKLDDTIRKVDDVIVGIETRKLVNDLSDMLSIKMTKKDGSGKKIGVKVSNTVRIAIETLKGMFRGFDGEFGNGLKSLVKSLDGMLTRKKELQGRLKELELSEASANERLNSGAITKDEYDAEIEAINSERDNVKSELANFDTEFSDALAETNDAIDAAVPRTTEEYNKLWNDLMTKQQDEQDGVEQMSAHDKEMLKIMPFVRSLVDVRELFAEVDKSQSRLKALEEQWKSDAPTPTDTEMEAANRRDRRLQTALKIREERARLYAAKDAARNALRDLNNDMRSLLKIGKTQYMAQQQERLEHRSEVAHIGITAVDTGKERPAGVKGQQQAKESEEKSVGVLRRMWNWVFLAPTESAESMLSRVDVNHFSGEGELYHLIMESERGYSRSEDRRIESIEALRSEIQSKCKEFFGSKKPKDGNKKVKFTQTLLGEPVPAEVTKGEALSLYLWSMSEEGRTKLESQGIDAFSISEIKAGLGENWVKFGEWAVGDFLPKLYDKYNEKYVEKYGTEITRHENYFPFKIYGGDIVTKDELTSFDNGNTIPMPSALKERVKHSYQLSTTEDALKILNEHVAEMEDWYHFADMREDISILLSSRAFRETLKLQGANKWRKFRDAMHALAGVDKRDESVTSQVINEAQSMYASSAVGFRYWTALSSYNQSSLV